MPYAARKRWVVMTVTSSTILPLGQRDRHLQRASPRLWRARRDGCDTGVGEQGDRGRERSPQRSCWDAEPCRPPMTVVAAPCWLRGGRTVLASGEERCGERSLPYLRRAAHGTLHRVS